MSARKLSKVTAEEMTELNASLRDLFERFSDSADSISSAGCVKFATDCGLLDKKLTAADIGLIFAGVKLGKKTELSYDRFQEAVRKMALSKEVTYQELVQMASGQEADSISAMAPAPTPATDIDLDWFNTPTQVLSVGDSMTKISAKLDDAPMPAPKEAEKAKFKRMSTFSLTASAPAAGTGAGGAAAPASAAVSETSVAATPPAAAPAPAPSPASAADDDAAIAALGEGCYLTYEAASGGTLCQNWSKKTKPGALAFFTTQRTGATTGMKPNKMSFKKNKGRLPIQTAADPAASFQNYALGWLGFLKNARKYQAELVVLADVPADLFFARVGEVLRLAKGQWIPAHAFGDAVAVVPSDGTAFLPSQLGTGAASGQPELTADAVRMAGTAARAFLQAGQKDGGAAAFTTPAQPLACGQANLFGAPPLPRMPDPPPPEPAAPTAAEAAAAKKNKGKRMSTYMQKKVDEKRAEEDAKTYVQAGGHKVELKMGCYLTHDDVHQGTFYLTWSRTPVAGAWAYFAPGMRARNINDQLFAYKSGKSELIRNVNGKIHQRNHCQGWCRFLKAAREKFGTVVLLKDYEGDGMGGEGAYLFLLRQNEDGEGMVEPVRVGVVVDMNEITGNDAACAVPMLAAEDKFAVKSMLRDVFLNYADNMKGWGMAFSGASARKTLPHQTLRAMRLEAEEAERRAAEEARPFAVEEVEEGCYLVHSDNNRGTLYECWSEDYVEDALAYFRPTRKVPAFKYKQNAGRSELKRGVNGNVGWKNLAQCWCQFIKTARDFGGKVVIFNDEGIAIYTHKDTVIKQFALDNYYTLDDELPNNSVLAVVKFDSLDFKTQTMPTSLFQQKGEAGGAQLTF